MHIKFSEVTKKEKVDMLTRVRPRSKASKLQAGVAVLSATILSSFSGSVLAQSSGATAPSSFPHVYPGQPSGDFSPAWQSCTCHHILCYVAFKFLTFRYILNVKFFLMIYVARISTYEHELSGTNTRSLLRRN